MNTSIENHGINITHLYGVISVIGVVVGAAISYKGVTGVYQWLLLASGWIVCLFLVWFTVFISHRLTNIIGEYRDQASKSAERIGFLESRIEDLKKEIDRRHATLDYISGLMMTGVAKPRQSKLLNETQSPGHQDDSEN